MGTDTSGVEDIMLIQWVAIKRKLENMLKINCKKT